MTIENIGLFLSLDMNRAIYTVSVQRDKIRESLYQMRDRREYNFGIFDAETSRLIGHISLYSIKRLPFSSGFVGYSIDERETGRGLGTEAVRNRHEVRI